jgi:hypothetical protein
MCGVAERPLAFRAAVPDDVDTRYSPEEGSFDRGDRSHVDNIVVDVVPA